MVAHVDCHSIAWQCFAYKELTQCSMKQHLYIYRCYTEPPTKHHDICTRGKDRRHLCKPVRASHTYVMVLGRGGSCDGTEAAFMQNISLQIENCTTHTCAPCVHPHETGLAMGYTILLRSHLYSSHPGLRANVSSGFGQMFVATVHPTLNSPFALIACR